MERRDFLRKTAGAAAAAGVVGAADEVSADAPIPGTPEVATLSVGGDLPLFLDKHYLELRCVDWFLDHRSSVFRKNQSTALARVTLGPPGDGDSYEVSIGAFHLVAGQHKPPARNQIILPAWRYDENKDITLGVSQYLLTGHTPLGQAASSVAEVGLKLFDTVVAGLSLGSFTPVMSVVDDLGQTVRNQVVNETHSPVMELEETFDLTRLQGSRHYFLFYRGWGLRPDNVSIDPERETALFHGQPLTQGAWILLRLDRLDLIGRKRPWTGDFREGVQKLDELMLLWETQVHPVNYVKANLARTSEVLPAIPDKIVQTIKLIVRDDALTGEEKVLRARVLNDLLRVADEAVAAGKPDVYFAQRSTILDRLNRGVYRLGDQDPAAPVKPEPLENLPQSLVRVLSQPVPGDAAAEVRREYRAAVASVEGALSAEIDRLR